ncbi:lipid IV(A) 3-deoxy-D-manno-octulosonic acid transferase [Duganella sp. FT27W]|uniref:lipid IV(A) 3-deoxy-D-manno-octulosonic acid transferase n=1 Tax=Duganella sp. FT27W TaxID=2654636 RepID=UPI00128C3C99|nr:lipid IV(A) 3-deoxy-D-manno-octulosonic acid transferase [Duganella sp. FT27W]MPQ59438.1 3-deoxy-D-manno-octulosonic acid transferase [Duganella sp. FT27W]
MRLLYTLLWWLALPLVLARLWLRGRREPGYRQHWAERLGLYGKAAPSAAAPVLWVHAVSVGETRASEPLVDALLAAYPDSRVVLTHMTPTGRETGRTLFARHGARLVQSYLPYDTGLMVSGFIRHFKPSVCILMETEVWPNLIATCGRRGVPVVLANARLSQRSLGKAQRLGALIRAAAQGITLVAAQTEADAARVRSLGVPRVEVTGSIKFDVVVPPAALAVGAALRAAIGARPVLLCASTRDGEEALILEAFRRDRAVLPAKTLLLIVPRHPQRFDDVEKMIGWQGMNVQRRSTIDTGAPLASHIDVVLGDSMGEMFAYYDVCDVAFVGGSLLPLGGQNLIEPAALGKPVLIGPHTFNFELVTQEAVVAGGAVRVVDAPEMMEQAARLLNDAQACSAMGARALAFASQHRGATARTLALLPPLLRRAAGD